MTKMFKVSNPSEARGNAVTAREILDKASSDIDTGLKDDPELQAKMMYTMAQTYEGLGLYSRAQSLLERGPCHPAAGDWTAEPRDAAHHGPAGDVSGR
jgi:non-specific serine/threonine protein kinase/serine/threonine-protein kinase